MFACLGRVRNDGIMIKLNLHGNCCASCASVRLGRTKRFHGNNNAPICPPKTTRFVLGCLVARGSVACAHFCRRHCSRVLPCFDVESNSIDHELALAGLIPTEFGKLSNLTHLYLHDNELSGTPSLLILPGVVVRVYCCKHVAVVACGASKQPH